MKKLLSILTFAIVLCLPVKAFAVITVLDSECGTTGPNKNKISLSLTGATAVSVATTYFTSILPPSVTETAGHTFTARTASVANGEVADQIFDYAAAGLSGSTTITVDCTGSPTKCFVEAICGISFSGSLTSGAFDVENGNSLHSGATTLTTGSVTPSECNMLAVTGLVDTGSTLATLPAGWLVTNEAGVSSVNFPTSIGTQVLTGTTAVNPTWTFGSGSHAASTIALYKSTDGSCGGGGGTRGKGNGLLMNSEE